MPYDKQKRKIDKNKKPEIYYIYERRRMNEKAQTHELTKEKYTEQYFSKKQSAIQYIRSCTDFNKIFIIRKRAGDMVNSYSYKNSMKMWTVLNRDGYFGGYKIGNPKLPCFCMGECKDPKHPAYKTTHY
jgi:hypothetical protein